MKYKYMEKQVEGAKALAEKYPHMQTHQDIYQEHVEVLKKARAFDEILRHANDEYKAPETKVELIIETIQYYMEDKNND
ncbi:MULTISPECIES: hypothetical protein [Staphylococcus]|uniref:hypothetical protein n=1 Tax=Staphylococcus TaxID=1279 RepID=UPI0008A230AB|nr:MULTISPECIES: hypothetical protein [Staphylococcus]OFO98694.1 hypothetical protein HMPREF3007_01470 [Staphylococcus sp. HMSC065E08]